MAKTIKNKQDDEVQSVYINPLTPTEMETYKRSLKRSYQMRDIANCARMEGREEGRMEGSRQFALKLLQKNTPVDEIVFLTELSKEQVQDLLQEN